MPTYHDRNLGPGRIREDANDNLYPPTPTVHSILSQRRRAAEQRQIDAARAKAEQLKQERAQLRAAAADPCRAGGSGVQTGDADALRRSGRQGSLILSDFPSALEGRIAASDCWPGRGDPERAQSAIRFLADYRKRYGRQIRKLLAARRSIFSLLSVCLSFLPTQGSAGELALASRNMPSLCPLYRSIVRFLPLR